ncbi:MAG: hypothetical protein KBD01_17485, partial [Acidobacteria bacterium]|nr:hypothetical protein [Acidobacteriota bacterium]
MPARRLLALALASSIVVPALAGNALVPGDLRVDDSTLHSLGFRLLVDGDDDRDAVAEVWYRATGDAGWRQGPPMLRVDGEPAGIDGWICGNLFAGS